MAFILKDRVLETTNTTGTGSLTLNGAVVGFVTFSSAIGNTNTTYYAIENPSTTQWEVGVGTVGAGTLARTTVLASSNGGSLVNFSDGSKNVFCDYAASKSVFKDPSDVVTVPSLVATTSVNITGTTAFNGLQGTSGQVLTSQGTGNVPTWTTNGSGTVTSVALTAPSIFTVTGSPITSTGTLALTYSGTPLPIANGGTNSTATPTAGGAGYGTGTAHAYTAAGTANAVLTSNGASAPTWSATAGVNQSDVGTAPNQLPLNQYLGNMAYQDKAGVILTGDAKINGITAGLGAGQVSTNTVYGKLALGSNVTGASNVAIGQEALRLTTTSNNTAVGYQAGYSNTTGANLTFVGYQAGYSNTTGRLTAIGFNALRSASTALWNTAVGYTTLYNTTGYGNTALGEQAGYANTSAQYNVFLGYNAGLNFNGTGDTYNTYVGTNTGQATTTGATNTALGGLALYSNTTASKNTAVGYQAGYGNASANANTTGSNNTYLGYQTVGSANNNTNEMVVGYTAVGLGSNTTVIGNSSTTRTRLFGTIETTGYTVATLPTGVVGMRAYVTNALTPTYGSAVVGGGAVTIPVFYNGTAWITA